MIIKNFLINLLLILLVTCAQAQRNLDSILQKVDNVALSYLQEKIHLHLDRDFYEVGETIWFKAYTTIGSNNLLSNHSGVLYVDLLSADKQKIQTQKLFLHFGISIGDFKLDENLPAGEYIIQAYTNYMRNRNEDFLFRSTIYIANQLEIIASKNKDSVELAAQKDYDVQLSMESGYLVEGISQKLAVKSLNSDGLGTQCDVYLFSGRDTIGRIATNKLGMGSTQFTANEGESYSAVAVFEDGIKKNVVFPKVEKIGYSLSVKDIISDDLFIQLSISEELIKNQEVYFVIHHLGEVYFKYKIPVNKKEYVLKLNRSKLPQAVLTATVFDENLQAIVERPFFNAKNLYETSVEVHLNKDVFAKREKVVITLDNNDIENEKSIYLMSAAVVNRRQIPSKMDKSQSILSSLLLAADIKGVIEQPKFYFVDDKINFKAIDDLLITQGWKKFDWQNLDNNMNLEYPVEKRIKLSGYTYSLDGENVEPFAAVTLLNKAVAQDIWTTQADEKGYFEFNDLYFEEDEELVLTAHSPKLKSKIKIKENIESNSGIVKTKENTQNSQLLNNAVAEKKQIFSKSLQSAYHNNNSVAIEEVKVVRSVKSLAAPHSQNFNGAGNADQIIGVEDLENMGGGFADSFAGRLRGVVFRFGKDKNGIPVQKPFSTRGGGAISVMLDGFDVAPEEMGFINVQDLQSVEYLSSPIYTSKYGSKGAHGILILTTKNGTYYSNKNFFQMGISKVLTKGFYKPSDFYKPRYDTKSYQLNKQDHRTTIHWEPKIVLEKGKKVSFDFFTADEIGTYDLILEGVNTEGKIISILKQIEVK